MKLSQNPLQMLLSAQIYKKKKIILFLGPSSAATFLPTEVWSLELISAFGLCSCFWFKPEPDEYLHLIQTNKFMSFFLQSFTAPQSYAQESMKTQIASIRKPLHTDTSVLWSSLPTFTYFKCISGGPNTSPHVQKPRYYFSFHTIKEILF